MRNSGRDFAAELAVNVFCRLTAVCIICIAAASCVSDEDAAPPDSNVSAAARGLSIAEGACAECHAVAAGETLSPDPIAPTFDALANRADMTRTALAVLLRTPHRTMPNLIVDPEQVDDLSAYLSTLRR